MARYQVDIRDLAVFQLLTDNHGFSPGDGIEMGVEFIYNELVPPHLPRDPLDSPPVLSETSVTVKVRYTLSADDMRSLLEA